MCKNHINQINQLRIVGMLPLKTLFLSANIYCINHCLMIHFLPTPNKVQTNFISDRKIKQFHPGNLCTNVDTIISKKGGWKPEQGLQLGN